MGDALRTPVLGASLPLQGVDDVHGSDSLTLGVFGVGDCVADDVLKEYFENATARVSS